MKSGSIEPRAAVMVSMGCGLCAEAVDVVGGGDVVSAELDSGWPGVFGFCALLCLFGFLLVLCRNRSKNLEREGSRNADFCRRLIRSQEEERRRIAVELHDSLGQNLLLIKTSAELALAGLDPDSPASVRLEQIRGLAADAVNEVRSITQDLRPPELDRLGLAAAVDAMVERICENAGVTVDRGLDWLDGQLPERDEISLYRIIQESLTNAMKHSEANRIRIQATRRNGDLSVLIEDDGRGFDPEAVESSPNRGGLGLISLRERAAGFGGKLLVDSAKGVGTSIRLTVPIADHEIKR